MWRCQVEDGRRAGGAGRTSDSADRSARRGRSFSHGRTDRPPSSMVPAHSAVCGPEIDQVWSRERPVRAPFWKSRLVTVPTTDERRVAIRELIEAADEFAERALLQAAARDRSRPGTGLHHQHAHSATLWRLAEQTLRTRIRELEP